MLRAPRRRATFFAQLQSSPPYQVPMPTGLPVFVNHLNHDWWTEGPRGGARLTTELDTSPVRAYGPVRISEPPFEHGMSMNVHEFLHAWAPFDNVRHLSRWCELEGVRD